MCSPERFKCPRHADSPLVNDKAFDRRSCSVPTLLHLAAATVAQTCLDVLPFSPERDSEDGTISFKSRLMVKNRPELVSVSRRETIIKIQLRKIHLVLGRKRYFYLSSNFQNQLDILAQNYLLAPPLIQYLRKEFMPSFSSLVHQACLRVLKNRFYWLTDQWGKKGAREVFSFLDSSFLENIQNENVWITITYVWEKTQPRITRIDGYLLGQYSQFDLKSLKDQLELYRSFSDGSFLLKKVDWTGIRYPKLSSRNESSFSRYVTFE